MLGGVPAVTLYGELLPPVHAHATRRGSLSQTAVRMFEFLGYDVLEPEFHAAHLRNQGREAE